MTRLLEKYGLTLIDAVTITASMEQAQEFSGVRQQPKVNSSVSGTRTREKDKLSDCKDISDLSTIKLA